MEKRTVCKRGKLVVGIKEYRGRTGKKGLSGKVYLNVQEQGIASQLALASSLGAFVRRMSTKTCRKVRRPS